MKYIFLVGLLFSFAPSVSAAVRGVGVSPGTLLDLGGSRYLVVSNLSDQQEWVEITKEGKLEGLSLSESRFLLRPQQQAAVLVEAQGRRVAQTGALRVSETRVSPEGLQTGTGIRVPVSIAAVQPTPSLAAAAFLSAPPGLFRVLFVSNLMGMLLAGLWIVAFRGSRHLA